MRILVLSFSYPPDIGPGSLRAKSIVEALVKEGPSHLIINVITTIPNRYRSLDISALQNENKSNVFINRVNIPRHKNGKFDQAKAFISFSLAVRRLVLKEKWDIIVATSSRLMTASLAAWIAKRTNSKLYLDIRDLFTDTILNLFEKKPLRILIPLFSILEKWTFSSANKLNVVSAGFLDHFRNITPNLSPSVYTNGVDDIFLNNDFSTKQIKSKPLVLYAGNIGDGQALHKIIPKVANELKEIQFRIIGDGSKRELLTDNYLFKLQTNIKILNPILRNELISEYEKADILFLHLNDYQAFYKVLPSKIFEYAATGKPILAGVSGYAAKFLTEQVQGVEIFSPCDTEGMKFGLKKLLNGPKIIDRKDFCLYYSRNKIMQNLALDILSLNK